MVLQRFLFMPFSNLMSRSGEQPSPNHAAETKRSKKPVIGGVESRKKSATPVSECAKPTNDEEDVQPRECATSDFVDQPQTGIGQVLQPRSNLKSRDETYRDKPFGTSQSALLCSRIMADDTEAAPSVFEEETYAIILDPNDSERRYYIEPYTAIKREIWRPGDGDGDRTIDYYESTGPLPALEKRWRFYQSRTGDGPIKSKVNEPPKYVILDDRAAYEVLASNIARKNLVQNWGHDFGGTGVIRAWRPHRGRAAIGDPDAPGDEKYHFGTVGQQKKDRYHFKGEEGYQPIIYRSLEPAPEAVIESAEEVEVDVEETKKRKADETIPEDADAPLLKMRLSHNQHTAKGKLVKNGAPGYGKPKPPKQLIPALRYIDPANLAAKAGDESKMDAQHKAVVTAGYGDEIRSIIKGREPIQQSTPASTEDDQGSSSDMEEFPFARRGSSGSRSQADASVSGDPITSVSNDLDGRDAAINSIEEDNDGLLVFSTFKPKSYGAQPDLKPEEKKKRIGGQRFELDDLKKMKGGKGASVVTTAEKIGWTEERKCGSGRPDKDDHDDGYA